MAPPPPPTSADVRWRSYAACAQASNDLFFELTDPARRRAAQAVCVACPAAEPCLWAALAAEQAADYRYGVGGGTTSARRARIAAGLPPVGLRAAYVALAAAWEPPPASHGLERTAA